MTDLNEEVCSICLDSLALSDDPEVMKGGVVNTVCDHYFHRDCILGWLTTKDRGKWCPLCKHAFCSKELSTEIRTAFGMPERQEVPPAHLPSGTRMIRFRTALASVGALMYLHQNDFLPFSRNPASLGVRQRAGSGRFGQWRRSQVTVTSTNSSPVTMEPLQRAPLTITRAARLAMTTTGPSPEPSVATTGIEGSAAPPAPANRPSILRGPRVAMPAVRPLSLGCPQATTSVSANAPSVWVSARAAPPSGSLTAYLPTVAVAAEAPISRSRDEDPERQGSGSRMSSERAGPSRRGESRSPVAINQTIKRRRER